MRRSLMAAPGHAAPRRHERSLRRAKTPEAWSTGVLQTVDPAARSLVVKQGAHEMTFELALAARIW